MTIKEKAKIETPAVLTKLKLQNVKIVFANLKDEGFGTSLTIDVTDKELQDKISAWVKENKIGKEAGVPNFKIYQPEDSETETIQYSLKINDYTRFIGVNGLEKTDLGFGAVVDLVANPFVYNNKFGKGVSSSLSAVLVKEKGQTGADEDVAELMADYGESEKPEETIEEINAFK
jgi:hypothetical protein